MAGDAELLRTVRALGAACAFACTGDVILAMGGRCLSQVNVNDALANASLAEPCAVGVRVTCEDIFGELLICEVNIDPPYVVSLGPTR